MHYTELPKIPHPHLHLPNAQVLSRSMHLVKVLSTLIGILWSSSQKKKLLAESLIIFIGGEDSLLPYFTLDTTSPIMFSPLSQLII